MNILSRSWSWINSFVLLVFRIIPKCFYSRGFWVVRQLGRSLWCWNVPWSEDQTRGEIQNSQEFFRGCWTRVFWVQWAKDVRSYDQICNLSILICNDISAEACDDLIILSVNLSDENFDFQLHINKGREGCVVDRLIRVIYSSSIFHSWFCCWRFSNGLSCE